LNVTETLFARRAVRAYAPRRVDDHLIRKLLHAAVQAPSAMNQQPWLFSIIQDVAVLRRYSDRAKAMLLSEVSADPKSKHYEDRLRSPAFNIFYDAQTLVVISVSERGPYADADCWLAAQNLMLAACDIGLGSCPIGFAIPMLNSAEVKAELGLPSSGAAMAPIIVGYPGGPAPPVTRREPKMLSWIR
jgi:nitroreductase